MEHMTKMPRGEFTEELIRKLDYLIEACKSGTIHNIVVLSDVDGDGHRLNTMLCMDDAHACAFLDRSIAALQATLQTEFDAAVDRPAH